ncbi:aminotransferase class IV family protein [Streptomyces justiciae]|uniref:aminotransferase class IV family protein n=1 Tax=Streptomyces justiciae TaxID=2780140 RepID=UPI0021187EB6|nr:aminotransferase class IV family protein [Streptomyces justiciae]MCW8383959.1 aminotransferase class IV family protein [Streptomyces justiciae]
MAYLNGHPATLDDVQALALTNFGHFTSMRVDDGVVRGLTLHMERLVRDCRTVFGEELDPERVLGYVRQAVAGRGGSFVARVTVYDPALSMAHPGAKATPNILVTAREAAPFPAPPMTVQAYTFTRDTAEVKHIGLFGQLLRRKQAELDGFDDALFADETGRISEGGTWNVGFVDQVGTVIWPEGEVLPGVTMRLLQQVHPSFVTRPVNLAELPHMRAAFATNTSIGVRTITAVGEIGLASEDPVLEELRKAYADIPGERL